MSEVTVLNRTHRATGLFCSFLLLCLVVAAASLRAQTSAPSGAQTSVQPSTPSGAQTTATPTAAPPSSSAPAPQSPAAASPQSPAQTPAQQPGAAPSLPTQDQPTETIKVQVNEVNLIFTVTDKKGKFITGLKRENFGLLDDGRPPIAVLRFQQQTDRKSVV